MFSLFSSFLNIWNIVITLLMSLFTNSIICVISGSVSFHCFFSLYYVIFSCFFARLVIFEWMLACWIFTTGFEIVCFLQIFWAFFWDEVIWKIWSFLLHSTRTAFGLELILPHYWNKTLLSALPKYLKDYEVFHSGWSGYELFLTLFELKVFFPLIFPSSLLS